MAILFERVKIIHSMADFQPHQYLTPSSEFHDISKGSSALKLRCDRNNLLSLLSEGVCFPIFMAMCATANPRARHTGFHRADGPIRRAGPRHAETADRLPGLAGTP